MLRWAFFVTWLGIFLALITGLWVMVRLSIKLDRDRADREVFQHLLRKIATRSILDAASSEKNEEDS